MRFLVENKSLISKMQPVYEELNICHIVNNYSPTSMT